MGRTALQRAHPWDEARFHGTNSWVHRDEGGGGRGVRWPVVGVGEAIIWWGIEGTGTSERFGRGRGEFICFVYYRRL